MKVQILLLSLIIPVFLNISCTQQKPSPNTEATTIESVNPFVGSWLLDSVVQINEAGDPEKVNVFKEGIIMYSHDGYMSAILTYFDDYGETPGLDVGYCGRYELNEEEGYVNHLRDVIAINADTENEIFTRDYILSEDGKYLTLSPRENTWKGTSLTWKRVE
ncbi:MAG: hypothetical protein R3250_17355 [Melioribacteraceae bacterium]|nr:hypothetical protein [Melioribacteraceae bacterium]